MPPLEWAPALGASAGEQARWPAAAWPPVSARAEAQASAWPGTGWPPGHLVAQAAVDHVGCWPPAAPALGPPWPYPLISPPDLYKTPGARSCRPRVKSRLRGCALARAAGLAHTGQYSLARPRQCAQARPACVSPPLLFFLSSASHPSLAAARPWLRFTTVPQTLEKLVRSFLINWSAFCSVLSFLLVGQCGSLFFYMLTALTFFYACKFASSGSEVSHASTHIIDVVLDCWVGPLARSSFLPIHVCLLATCYMLDKMTQTNAGQFSLFAKPFT